MSEARHRADNALSATEELGDVVGRADEGAAEVLLLRGELFALVIRSIITVEEYLSFLENIKLYYTTFSGVSQDLYRNSLYRKKHLR